MKHIKSFENENKKKYIIHTPDNKKTMTIWTVVDDEKSSGIFFKKLYTYFSNSKKLVKYGNDENFTRIDRDNLPNIQNFILYTSVNIKDCTNTLNILINSNKFNL